MLYSGCRLCLPDCTIPIWPALHPQSWLYDYSADICIAELVTTEEKLKDLESRVSFLGGLITDQPATLLPQELSDTIRSLQSGI